MRRFIAQTFFRRQALEGRVKGTPDGADEDGLDDLFGDVGSEEDGSGSSDESDSDDLMAETSTRKPSRVGGAGRASSGDMGDGLTLHEGRLVVEVRREFSHCSAVPIFMNVFAGARRNGRARP